MKQRTITAVFFTLAMLAGIYGGKTTFFILFSLVVGGCAWELGQMAFRSETRFVGLRIALCTVLAGGVFVVMGGDILHYWQISPLVTTALIPVVFTLLATTELFLAGKNPIANIATHFLGVFYLAIPFLLLVLIAVGDAYYPHRVLGLLLLVWTNDVGAYLVGSRWGKNKLMERISPKKTWEGTLGGAVMAVLAAWILSRLMTDFTLIQWIALSQVAAVGSNVGDLVESMFKRSAGVKDSGQIMPGHGGLLDRFDAFIYCLPLYWLVLQFL